jgi:hypothetical protein
VKARQNGLSINGKYERRINIMVKQITVFLENKQGRLEEVTGCLADENINLHALSIADTTEFGILRMIVSEPEKAVSVLKKNNFMVKTNDVIAVALGHKPGSLHNVLKKLKAYDISIEYIYAFTSRHKDYDAILILSVDNQATAVEKLKDGGFPVLDDNLLARLNQS